MSDDLDERPPGLPNEHRAVLNALRGCVQKHPNLIRLKDVAGHAKMDEERAASLLGDLQRAGIVGYNLKTGYTLDEPAAKLAESISKPLAEYGGGIAGRSVGARTMFPISFATITDINAKKAEKIQRADETRRRVRDRLRELAQEGRSLPRRPLRAVES